MIKTEITLSQSEYDAAKSEADIKGISLSELVRRSLARLLSEYAEKPWMRYAGMIESGDPNSSQNIDRDLYE